MVHFVSLSVDHRTYKNFVSLFIVIFLENLCLTHFSVTLFHAPWYNSISKNKWLLLNNLLKIAKRIDLQKNCLPLLSCEALRCPNIYSKHTTPYFCKLKYETKTYNRTTMTTTYVNCQGAVSCSKIHYSSRKQQSFTISTNPSACFIGTEILLTVTEVVFAGEFSALCVH